MAKRAADKAPKLAATAQPAKTPGPKATGSTKAKTKAKAPTPENAKTKTGANATTKPGQKTTARAKNATSQRTKPKSKSKNSTPPQSSPKPASKRRKSSPKTAKTTPKTATHATTQATHHPRINLRDTKPTKPYWLFVPAGLTLLATAGGYLARLGYPFELLSHFRPQFMAACAIMALALIIARQWRWAGISVLAAAANWVAVIAPFMIVAPPLVVTGPLVPTHPTATGPTATGPTAVTGPPSLPTNSTRLVWANLHGEPATAQRLADTVTSFAPDIVALTELHHDTDLAAAFPDHPCVIRDNDPSYYAVVLLTKAPCPPLSPDIGGPWPHAVQRTVLNNTLTVVAFHAARPVDLGLITAGPTYWPTAGTVGLRNAVTDHAAQAARTDAPALLVGDMNAAPWSPQGMDVARRGLTRARCDGPWASTWLSRWPFLGLPIDHAYVTDDLAIDCQIGPDVGSDHWPLLVTVAPLPAAED